MVQYLANKTAHYLAKDDDPADIEVVAYGYYMFYQQWLVVIGILLVASVLGLLPLVIASLITSMVLRGCVGGTHATHPVICKIAAFVLAFAPAALAILLADGLTLPVVAAMYVISVAVLVKHAPGETDVKKISDPRVRKQMKIQSIAWATAFFAASALLLSRLPAMAFVIAATALATCFFAHPAAYRLFGFDPVTKEARKARW